eukprot:9551605-Heterocapsa_arctica.AAC.1
MSLFPITSQQPAVFGSGGATVLHGAPPSGPLERQVEKALRRSGAQIRCLAQAYFVVRLWAGPTLGCGPSLLLNTEGSADARSDKNTGV